MEKHDEIIVPEVGPGTWYTKDLGGNGFRYKINDKGLLVHSSIESSYPVHFNGLLHFSGTTTNQHKVRLGFNAELSVTLRQEHKYRAHMTSGMCGRIEKKVGNIWLEHMSHETARRFIDGFHYYFPPLSEWKPK